MKQPHRTTTLEKRMHADYRDKLRRETIHAAFLRAKHRIITARLAQGRKQLPLPIGEAA